MLRNEKLRLRQRIAELESQLELHPKNIYRCHTPFKTSAKHGNVYVAVGDEFMEGDDIVRNRERFFNIVGEIKPGEVGYEEGGV